jgi:phage terminase large subunit
MEIKATTVFERNWNALHSEVRFVVNQGGSRSSKTYSLCQCVILYCLQNPNKVVSIVRKTFPALRATVMRDFIEVIKEMDLYSKEQHNKSENIFTFRNGSIVEFFSVDDEQKIRGRKRDIAWVNEANELWHDDFLQLNMRTAGKLIFDYNPSDSDSWIYALPQDEKVVIKSTYKDNPFLEKSIRKQIEDLKHTDEALYQIYALGEQAVSRENVYQPWEVLTQRPERFRQFVYGIDFGYQHPTALIKIWHFENEFYLEEVLYESYLTSAELIEKMKVLEIEMNTEIIADYARPEMIQEMRNSGYYVLNADKSVEKGINSVRTSRMYVDHKAKNIIRENKNYKHKKINGDIRDKEVAKKHDDAMDAIRYGVLWVKQFSTSGTDETLSINISFD